MEFRRLVADRKGAVLRRWFDAAVAAYPAEFRDFLAREGGPLRNPVGAALRGGLDRILDGLIAGEPASAMAPAIEEILRIRAVQDLSPSQAVGFLFALPGVVREELRRERPAAEPDGAPRWLDERIAELALGAFDVFVRFREQVYELRTAEQKNRMFRLLQRAKLVCGIDDRDLDAPADAGAGGPGTGRLVI